jgi:hydrogenase expression/formation protein HypE
MYLTLGMILESGFPIAKLKRALESIRDTAAEAGVRIVAGDTKVVRKGEADGIYLNTTGVGVFHRPPLRMANVRPGDQIVLSGPIGNHTVHLLSVREGLGFEKNVLSDCAPLNGMIATVLDGCGDSVRSLRDVTRGGLSAVLHEYATAVDRTLRIEQEALPIDFETVMACDMLGINPINAANEGCVCLFVDPAGVDQVLDTLHAHKYGHRAVVIGEVTDRPERLVELIDADGRANTVEELRGAELPRLC